MRSCSKLNLDFFFWGKLNSGFWHEKIQNDCKVEIKRKFWILQIKKKKKFEPTVKYYSVWRYQTWFFFWVVENFRVPSSNTKTRLDLWNVHFMSLWFSMKLRSSLGTSRVPSSNNQSAFFFREKPDFLQILGKKKRFPKNVFLEYELFPMKHFKTNGSCYVFQYMSKFYQHQMKNIIIPISNDFF